MSTGITRVAVVGAGWWAEAHHIPSLATYRQAELTAIIDRRVDHAAALARQFNVPHRFASVDELIEAEVAECAIVSTPHTTHHAIVKSILEAGMHVLVEKPITTCTSHAVELVELAEQRGLHLSVGYTYQFSPTASVVRDWVRSQLGDLVQVTVEFSSRTGALYAATVADDTSSAYSSVNGAGQGTTQLTHAMAALLWTTGEQVTDVAAITSNRGLAVDVVDSALFTLSGGASGVATSTGTIGKEVPMRHQIRYIGEHGTVDHNLIGATARLRLDTGEQRSIAPDHNLPAYPAQRPARAFIDLVTGSGENFGPPRPAAATVAFIDAMYRSANEHSFVHVTQIPKPDAL